ncbi:hypothetical protein [Yinghuangia soli]|uniref:Uncharacterized protein n=1 Tax=Yinghuangia soli TaxID=2908204 RepID=A0AA41Q815_9ACTN|nr:hypothetical protein [Yinghuangia soli]MCF2533305.1 hypothetical protein [Yinghuangia soli]
MRDPSDVLLVIVGGGTLAGTIIAVVGWLSLLLTLIRWGGTGRGWWRRRRAAATAVPPALGRPGRRDYFPLVVALATAAWLTASVFAAAWFAALRYWATESDDHIGHDRHDEVGELIATDPAQGYLALCVAAVLAAFILAWGSSDAAFAVSGCLGFIVALPFLLIEFLLGVMVGLGLALWIALLPFGLFFGADVEHGKFFKGLGPGVALFITIGLYLVGLRFVVEGIVAVVQDWRTRRSPSSGPRP